MADIKTRDVVSGTIKAIDKSAVAAERMKDAFIRTKDEAQCSASSAEDSPEKYAADEVTSLAETAASRTVQEFDKQGRKAVQQSARFHTRPFSDMRPSTFIETPQPETAGARFKREEHKRMLLRTQRSSGETIKTSVREKRTRSIKTADRAVKPVDRSIRTAKQMARTVPANPGVTVKTANTSAQRAKAAARSSAEAVKKAAAAGEKAVRAILAATKALVNAILAGSWIAITIVLVVVLLGAALSLFGSESGRTSYVPVSAEVEAYTPVIRVYANQYGIGKYVELIKAIMMQESGGQGLDPMQASESGYNTRYPRTPNAITDPEYSIDVGVQTIADSLRQAEVESPVDMENIKLALQGYNFGNGFIPWARENYGGYSAIAAIEFSNYMAAQLGWNAYGDKQYPAHVLRYYPFGRVFTTEGNQAIVEIALTQVGNVGGELYWSWWGLSERAEWCAMFVSWCADQAGLLDTGAIPKFENCVWGANWFKDNAGWADGSAEPSPGDIIFFDWEPDGCPDHVGIVEKCEDGRVYTIEGNVNDDCAQGRYYVGDTCIFGYGLPAY